MNVYESLFGAGCAFRLDGVNRMVYAVDGASMSYDDWLNAVSPARGRERLEALLFSNAGEAEFSVVFAGATHTMRARCTSDTIFLSDVTSEQFALKSTVIREVLRTTGVLCFEYDVESDEITIFDAAGEYALESFSQGAYGRVVRAVLASDADTGSVSVESGRVWYTRALDRKNKPQKYMGAMIPARLEQPVSDSHMDRIAASGYTCIGDTEKWRAERYQLLCETPGVITFDYEASTDALCYSLSVEGGARAEIVSSDYLAEIDSCRRLEPLSREVCKSTLLHALRAPTSGSIVYRADFYCTGHRWYRLHYISVADESGRVCRVVGRADDIEEEMSDREDLMRSALTDGVTGLYNRSTAQKFIEHALSEPRNRKYDALFVIDVDDLSVINNTCGHLAGDMALTVVADAIRAVYREQDIKGRFGGDEFVVYMRSFSDPNLPRIVARRFMNKLAESAGVVSCSVGVTLVGEYPERFEDVFSRADTALYKAKSASKSCFALYGD